MKKTTRAKSEAEPAKRGPGRLPQPAASASASSSSLIEGLRTRIENAVNTNNVDDLRSVLGNTPLRHFRQVKTYFSSDVQKQLKSLRRLEQNRIAQQNNREKTREAAQDGAHLPPPQQPEPAIIVGPHHVGPHPEPVMTVSQHALMPFPAQLDTFAGPRPPALNFPPVLGPKSTQTTGHAGRSEPLNSSILIRSTTPLAPRPSTTTDTYFPMPVPLTEGLLFMLMIRWACGTTTPTPTVDLAPRITLEHGP